MTLADVRNRWSKFNNLSTFFITGTDEHGLKVQNAAEKAQMDPKLFCDELSDKFKDLAKLGDIKYDRFIRTTDKDHYESVTHFWKTVYQKGLIEKGTHSGWYSISDECFYTDLDIEESVNESTGEKIMVSKETGSEVVYQTEENYFFKLSHFQSRLIDHLKANPGFIKPQKYHDYILNELQSNELPDLSISRPTWRLTWAIPVPGDKEQSIYVWFDALINYLTCIGYPKIDEFPQMTHLVGKDIIKFHCIHWPILLMATDLPMPKEVVVHGHWLMGGRKMSKSRGNVADPIEISQYYDKDALRMFMMRYSVLDTDGDYTEESLNLLRSEFIDKFCNLLIRSLSKNFSIERALQRIQKAPIEDLIEKIDNEEFKQTFESIKNNVNSLVNDINYDINTFQMHKAMKKIFNLGPQVNSLFDKFEPWKLKSKTDMPLELQQQNQLFQDLIIFTALDSLRVILITLQAFTPEYSRLLLDRLKVDPQNRCIEYTKLGSDLSYGKDSIFKKGQQVPLKKLELQSKV